MDTSNDKDLLGDITTTVEDPTKAAVNPFKEDDWRHSMGDPSLSRFETPADLHKSYKELERWKGSHNKITNPFKTEGATEQDFDAFWNELGRPATLDEYKLDYDVKEENKGLVDEIKAIAHQEGVLPRQLEAVMKTYDEAITKVIEEQQSAEEKRVLQAVENFRKELGDEFEPTINRARQASKQFMSEEQLEHFKMQGLTEDPEFVKFLANIGSHMAEDNTFKGSAKATFGMTKEQAIEEAQNLRNDPDFYADTPRGKTLVEKVNKLMELATRG